MSTSNTMPPSEAIPPSRRRPPSFILPEDPSPEDLAQAWTLSDRDKAEVLRCRGDAQRRRFAVQLCTLRIYGRFLPEAVAATVAITNHLARQLGLPLVLFEEVPGRFATETEHWHRIRAYLGWQSFDEPARTRLTHWLTQRATDDLLPSDLMTVLRTSPKTGRLCCPHGPPWKNLSPRSRPVCKTTCIVGSWRGCPPCSSTRSTPYYTLPLGNAPPCSFS
jgi:hypothetical protein